MCWFVDIMKRTPRVRNCYNCSISKELEYTLTYQNLGYSSVHRTNVSTVSNNIQQPLYIVPALRSQPQESYKSKGSSKISSAENGDEGSIYMLQTIRVGNTKMNLFFDTGFSELVSKRGAILNLEKLNRA